MSNFKAVYLLNQQAIVTGGLNPTGAYDNAHAYSKGDSVSYGGSSYLAIQATTGNLPTNTTYWQLLASIGNIGPAGPLSRNVSSVSTATNAGSSAGVDYVYLVSGTTTITLPTAVSNTNLYSIKNVDTHTVTIATTSAQTIDGSTTASLPVQYTSLDLISDGSNWNIV